MLLDWVKWAYHRQAMKSRIRVSAWSSLVVRMAVVVMLLSFAADSRAVTFSTDGPSSVPNGPADLLNPGAVPSPPIILPGGAGYGVDAFSFGHLGPIDTSTAFFSVSPGSVGAMGTAVFAESGGDESADIFSSAIGSGLNGQVYDGNGLPSGTMLGLPEPSMSNLDGLDLRMAPTFSLYWSVDPATAAGLIPYSSGSASGGDVWFSPPVVGYAITPVLYAATTFLGLSASDDIDALVVVEDGTAGFAFATDVVFLSLAPGSPTLAGLGAGPEDILVVGGGAALSVFASGASIGLVSGDNLDALDFAVIPEPATGSFLLVGACGLFALRRRRR